MERADLHELHFITEISNVPSILERGILSNRLVSFPERRPSWNAHLWDVK